MFLVNSSKYETSCQCVAPILNNVKTWTKQHCKFWQNTVQCCGAGLFWRLKIGFRTKTFSISKLFWTRAVGAGGAGDTIVIPHPPDFWRKNIKTCAIERFSYCSPIFSDLPMVLIKVFWFRTSKIILWVLIEIA